jgi:hypothetical protein
MTHGRTDWQVKNINFVAWGINIKVGCEYTWTGSVYLLWGESTWSRTVSVYLLWAEPIWSGSGSAYLLLGEPTWSRTGSVYLLLGEPTWSRTGSVYLLLGEPTWSRTGSVYLLSREPTWSGTGPVCWWPLIFLLLSGEPTWSGTGPVCWWPLIFLLLWGLQSWWCDESSSSRTTEPPCPPVHKTANKTSYNILTVSYKSQYKQEMFMKHLCPPWTYIIGCTSLWGMNGNCKLLEFF